MSVTECCEKTNAIDIYSKRGKCGDVYTHKDIVFEFASAMSFKWYDICKYQLDIINNAEKIKFLNESKDSDQKE